MNSVRQVIDVKELSPSLKFLKSYRGTFNSLELLAGDLSSRRYYRVKDDQGKSFVLQEDQPFVVEKPPSFLLVRSLLSELNIRVPEVVAMSPERGWVLLEDLGDLLLQRSYQSNGFEFVRDHFEKSLQFLARWSVFASLQNSKLIEYSSCPAFSLCFDEEKFAFERNYTATHLWNGLLKASSDEYQSAVLHNDLYLTERPRVFCHRDYHTRNIMLSPQVVAIDFQDARMGPASYDLVSLIWDPYVELAKSSQEYLINFYRKTLKNEIASGLKEAAKEGEFFKQLTQLDESLFKGSGDFTEAYLEEIERMKIQRFLKAAGSYAGFFRLKGRPDFIDKIPVAINTAIGALNNLKDFRKHSDKDSKLLSLLSAQKDKINAILDQR